MSHVKRFIRILKILPLWLAPALLVSGAQAQSPPQNTAGKVKRAARRNETPPPEGALGQALREMEAELRELRIAVREAREEAAQARAETAALRGEFAASRRDALQPVPPQMTEETTTGQRITKLEEDAELLNGKVNEQYQSKVESASKYRMRLSGIVLLNLFGTRGAVDNLDFPELALGRGPLGTPASLGLSVRQSQLGLEVFGPVVAGAKTSGDVSLDLAGGFPGTPNGVTAGILRLRTATLRMDWEHTSLVAGQDAPFFAPLYPTSLVSLAQPGFSYSGKLWSWTPQVRVERRLNISESSSFLIQGGILDALSGDFPSSQFYRTPQAGEKSGQPAYAGRVAWTQKFFGRKMTLGAGGYYSRQNWGAGRTVDAWTGTTDWSVPLGRWFDLTGEFYRGRAIGGLGGGIGNSVVFVGLLNDPATQLHGLNSEGGWAQLKFKPAERFEINGAFGQDNPRTADVRLNPANQLGYDPPLVRNQTAFLNFIYRPRSDLLVSAEYRHLSTAALGPVEWEAHHITLSLGVLF